MSLVCNLSPITFKSLNVVLYQLTSPKPLRDLTSNSSKLLQAPWVPKNTMCSSSLAIQVPWAIARVIYTMAPSHIVLYGLLSCPLTVKSCCNDISNIMCMRKGYYYINGELQTLRTQTCVLGPCPCVITSAIFSK